MATKEVFGEYAAFETQGGVRFQKNNKLTSEKDVPAEVVSYLKGKLGIVTGTTEVPKKAKFPRPTPEQIAAMKAESLKVPVELARSDEEMEAARLSSSDFEVEPTVEEIAISHLALDSNGNEPLPRTDTSDGFTELVPEEVSSPVRPVPVEADFLETVSIHTANIKDIAEALYNRFGLYTVYLDRLPEADEINPLTGEVFSKYHLGIAYQAAIRAQHTGVTTLTAEEGRRQLEAGREASANFRDTFVPVPQTMGDARRANSFDYRTSPQATRSEARTEIVHERGADGQLHAVQRDIPAGEVGQFNGATSRYDQDEEQPLVEPQFGRQVIRPNW